VVSTGSSADIGRVTIAACVLAALCEGFDLQAAGVAAGGIVAEFRPSPDQMGTFFSASTLGLFLGALLGGRLSDRFGRKGLLIAAVTMFGLFSVATACAWNMHSLIAGRLFTGFGLGGALPVLVALVNERSPAHRRRANVALAYSAMPLGGAIVSLLSMLSAAAHWRTIFMVGGVVPLLLVPLMQMTLRDSARAAAPTAATGGAQSIFGGGRAPATLFVWISCFFGLLILYLLLSWLPTLLVESGFSKTQAAGAQISFNIGGALASLILGQLLESRWRIASLVVTTVAAPLLVFWLSNAPADIAWVAFIAFALGGAIIATQGYLYATAALVYPMAIRGVGLGATVAVGRIGSIVGPKLGGTLKSAGHSSAQLLGDILPLVILGSAAALVVSWLVSRRTGIEEPAATPSA
jgi:AAHS family 3-hydroxyphenylpropionic acid transporter